MQERNHFKLSPKGLLAILFLLLSTSAAYYAREWAMKSYITIFKLSKYIMVSIMIFFIGCRRISSRSCP